MKIKEIDFNTSLVYSTPHKMKALFLRTDNDGKYLVRHSLIVLILSSVATLISMFYLDWTVADFFNRPELKEVYYYSREVTNIGYSIHYLVLALFGFFFSGWLYPRYKITNSFLSDRQNQNIFTWSILTLKALFVVGIAVHIPKIIIGRKRPHVSENFNPFNFDFFNLHHHWHSMPSGHAQVLFTVAACSLLIWPRQKYLFLGLALVFSLTRVSIHQHFLSDIIAGGSLGYLGTLWLEYLWPTKQRIDRNKI